MAAVWFTYAHVLKAFRVRVDRRFVYALLPFIVLGGLTRSVGDVFLATARPYASAFCTPGIYVIMFAVTLAVFYAALLLQRWRSVPYHKTMIAAGVTLIAADLAYLSPFVANYWGMAIAMGIALGWALVLYVLSSLLPKYLTKENAAILWAHMFDASATFTALQFNSGLVEEHVLPNFFIGTLGLSPAVMFVLKLAVVWPVLYYIDRDVKETEYRTWLKIVVLILGLALGTRDVFSIGILGTLKV